MVYIVGCYHCVQHDGGGNIELSQLKEDFINYIIEKINELNIILIAEEYNEEALNYAIKNLQAFNSTAKSAAISTGIEHRFCDPDREERKDLGIPSTDDIKVKLFGKNKQFLNHNENQLLKEEEKKYWDIREKFWLEKIRNKAHEHIIFICGADHPERLKSLLISEGFEAEIIISCWKGDYPYSKICSLNLI